MRLTIRFRSTAARYGAAIAIAIVVAALIAIAGSRDVKLAGSSPALGKPHPTGVGGTWSKFIFDDEFSNSSLNTSKWTKGWFGSGVSGPVNSAEINCYDPNNVSVANGSLRLSLIQKSESCSGKTRPYAGSLINTDGKFQYTYGFMEVRAYMAGSASAMTGWPAIWSDGQNWPTNGEDDIMEGLNGQACYHFHDPSGGPGGCPGGGYGGAWHTFASDWEPGYVTYYYDGVKVGNINSGITGAPMYLILNASTSSAVPNFTEQIDYVRIWQH